jgi:hypothetical protein
MVIKIQISLHGNNQKFKIYNFYFYINFKLLFQIVFYNKSLLVFR